MRYRITVDQAAIRYGSEFPIHVHDTETGQRQNVRFVAHGAGRTVYDPEGQQDGARVWVETDTLVSSIPPLR